MKILTYASTSFRECLATCSGTWGEHENLFDGDDPIDWLDGVGRKALAVQQWLASAPDGVRFVFLDADCIVRGNLDDAFTTGFDIAYTDGPNRERYDCIPACGVFFGVTGTAARRFVDAWVDLQAVYRKAGIGVRKGFQAYDQYAFAAALSLPCLGVRLHRLDEGVWNFNDIMGKTPEQVARDASGAVVVHLKAGRWRTHAHAVLSKMPSKAPRMPVDCVWIHGDGSAEGDVELRYSIRSAVAHVRNRGKVVVVGVKPDYLTGVHHIDVQDCFTNNREANMIRKVLAACDDPSVSDPFLLLSDDHFLLQDIEPQAFGPIWKNDMAHKTGGSGYAMRVKNTAEVCKSLGLPTLNYDCHMPMLIHKDSYRDAMARVKWDDDRAPGVLCKSVYGNTIGKGTHGRDGKDIIRGRMFSSCDDVRRALAGSPCFSTEPRIGRAVKKFMAYRYANKTAYEVDDVPPVQTEVEVQDKPLRPWERRARRKLRKRGLTCTVEGGTTTLA